MSFVRTLAALAAGVAAAKGYDKFRQVGGMSGVQKALQDNPMLAKYPEAQRMIEQLTGAAGRGGESAQAGLAQLMSALGGAAAGGASQSAAMLDAMMGGTAATDRMEDQARLMIRAMIMAAKSDGVIDAEERAKIEAHLQGATREERAFVEAEMAGPVDVVGLARDTEESLRSQVYSTAAAMCRGDSPAETQFLAALGGALMLDLPTRQGLHASLGIAPPSV